MKALQREASNRAIAEAIRVAEGTIRNDQKPAAQDYAPEPEPDEAAEAEGEALPAFLAGDDWSPRERATALALYRGLPDDCKPTVAATVK